MLTLPLVGSGIPGLDLRYGDAKIGSHECAIIAGHGSVGVARPIGIGLGRV